MKTIQRRAVWLLVTLALVVNLAAVAAAVRMPRAHAQPTSVTVWVQTQDSCRQAIGPGLYQVQGNGENQTFGATTVASGTCPIQQGNCTTVPVGCMFYVLAVPLSGTVTYTITEVSPPAGYAECNGGSVCPAGGAVVTVVVDATGAIDSLTTTETYPDGTVVTWPNNGTTWDGSQSNPAVIHDAQTGNNSCDGDGDADDHLGGGNPGSHCDSDHD